MFDEIYEKLVAVLKGANGKRSEKRQKGTTVVYQGDCGVMKTIPQCRISMAAMQKPGLAEGTEEKVSGEEEGIHNSC